MLEVNNAYLLVITGTDTFPGNKICCKAARSCQSIGVPTLFQLSWKRLDKKLSKGGIEPVGNAEIWCRDYPGINLAFTSLVELFDYAVDEET